MGKPALIAAQGNGEIHVDPGTVGEGQDVEVSNSGEVEIFYRIDSGPWMPLPIDPRTRTGKVTAPLGARVIHFWDKKDVLGGTFVNVVSAARS